ncbi:MAG: ParB-like nuclease domain-containing protein [Clostridiales bacterium]|nr:ParB-like nuclease domain-containing protein [Clostridiales bacterium]
MAKALNEFERFLQDEVAKYKGVMMPIKAGFLERIFKKKEKGENFHPNPDDEFTWSEIGPNYSIINDYHSLFVRARTMTPYVGSEALMVEKIHPSGYLILNGHHRWAAGMRAGFKKMPISIVNLTQETDIKKMIQNSKHDKRVTLDLDEVIFCRKEKDVPEKRLSFPFNKMYKERIRLGISALLHLFAKEGYDVWIYSWNYYSMEYIKAFFHKYHVNVDGIITGTKRKEKGHSEAMRRTRELFEGHYKETIHIDRYTVTRTFTGTKNFEEYPIAS